MDVDGSSGIPSREDGLKLHLSRPVGDLIPAQEFLSNRILSCDVGVDAQRAALPDVDEGAGQRGDNAIIDTEEIDRQVERKARLDRIVGRVDANIVSMEYLVHEIWAFGQ